MWCVLFWELLCILGKTLMTSSYFSYDISLRYNRVYCTLGHGKSSYLGKLSEQVRIWLLTFLDGTCIQMSSISFENATLDYIYTLHCITLYYILFYPHTTLQVTRCCPCSFYATLQTTHCRPCSLCYTTDHTHLPMQYSLLSKAGAF